MNILKKYWCFFIRFASTIIRLLVPVKKGRVFCESYGGVQYSCNPKYIAEYILENHSKDYQIIFSYVNPDIVISIDSQIKKVKKSSLKWFYYIYTSEFIISNNRMTNSGWDGHKRKGQKYIMTWHGSMALKCVEFDAADQLPISYLTKAEQDSKIIDLMLSDSKWCTSFIRKAFHYHGEILEKGLPRNDIFFQPNKINTVRDKVRQFYKIEDDKKVLLYAPTFRVDKSVDNYISQWDQIIATLKDRFKEEFIIMVRLHPNMMKMVDPSVLMTHRDVIDATQYSDMQELLCTADILMTDYSSSMFEFALMDKPCFLYVPDAETYDRGFYFQIESLPFPMCKNLEDLSKQILSFDEIMYKTNVNNLFDKTLGFVHNVSSCKELVNWMHTHSIE